MENGQKRTLRGEGEVSYDTPMFSRASEELGLRGVHLTQPVTGFGIGEADYGPARRRSEERDAQEDAARDTPDHGNAD